MQTLSSLGNHKYGRIVSFRDNQQVAFYCIEMGLCENVVVQVLDKLLLGGNLVILSKNGKYTIRKEDADQIMVEEVSGMEA